MLRHFGARIEVARVEGGRRITLSGEPELHAAALAVPGDPSSAAFPAVAALITPGLGYFHRGGRRQSAARRPVFHTWPKWGPGSISSSRANRAASRWPISGSGRARLHGVEVPAARAPSMIDEYPVAGGGRGLRQGPHRDARPGRAARQGKRPAGGDRDPGSRLAACTVEVEGDTLDRRRRRTRRPRAARKVAARLDHRIAMAFLVLGGAAQKPVSIDDGDDHRHQLSRLRQADERPGRAHRRDQDAMIAP